jgi:TrpR-related protein YerC/YecD
MRKKFYDLKPEDRKRMLSEFCDMMVGIKNKKDVEKFLRDLLTPSEIIMIITRIEIAKMLLIGFPYENIRKKLKVGYSTIGTVNRWLFSGFGGYMNELKKAKTRKERRNIFPINEWQKIKKKYPIHFMLFNLVDECTNSKKDKK